MSYEPTNVFAQILRGEIPANIVYEDAYCFAFHDANPKARVHVLVIPKGAYVDVHDFISQAQQDEVYGYFQGVKKTIEILSLHENGFRITSNAGEHGCQEVPHFHMHIFGGEKLPKSPLGV